MRHTFFTTRAPTDDREKTIKMKAAVYVFFYTEHHAYIYLLKCVGGGVDAAYILTGGDSEKQRREGIKRQYFLISHQQWLVNSDQRV